MTPPLVVEAAYMAADVWVTAVWVTVYVSNDFSMAASVLDVAAGAGSWVLDSDVLWVVAASVPKSGVSMAAAAVNCVSESDVWVVVVASVTT
jgi:hypothetical protein